ncbi:MAG TPA: hypothetical protein VGO00_04430 [Kofleriaceae bacterium]|nr:hypothetical protein [Kofleriaceae bacterium]
MTVGATRKLRLATETIGQLTSVQLAGVVGGSKFPQLTERGCPPTLWTCNPDGSCIVPTTLL